MRKIKLDLDALSVDSFVTAASGGVGTVRARADLGQFEALDIPRDSFNNICDTIIIAPPRTQAATCPVTCQGDTCIITCITACSCITLPCAGCA
ncbi:MAG TPA: hypothetical protein VF092_05900 [Longimicrobium sp.]